MIDNLTDFLADHTGHGLIHRGNIVVLTDTRRVQQVEKSQRCKGQVKMQPFMGGSFNNKSYVSLIGNIAGKSRQAAQLDDQSRVAESIDFSFDSYHVLLVHLRQKSDFPDILYPVSGRNDEQVWRFRQVNIDRREADL